MEDAEAAVQNAAERLLEDEALRGDLTDAGFAPLLDWALAQLGQAAQQAADTERFEQQATAIRRLMRDLTAAASSGDFTGLADAVAIALGEPAAQRLLAELPPAQADADANAQALLQAIQRVTTPATGSAPVSLVKAPPGAEKENEA